VLTAKLNYATFYTRLTTTVGVPARLSE